MSRRTLTFSEIFSKTKSLIQELWKTPPTHPWYNRQAPGGALSIKADRVVQTTIRLEREDIYSSPLLVYDFLRTLGLMGPGLACG
ncbi:hypothetical protein TNCV_391501 [Trichonephila clavipes]|nr:hypothetical protein TNCV_391501 [Trichonephila clavipes]